MMGEKVILVDETDTPLGEMEKLEVHESALLHRAVSVFLFNGAGQLLLQKRAQDKYHSPDLWTNTACTHPFPNESNEAAALRRLRQEMGIALQQLTPLFHFIYKEKLQNGLTEHELDHVFVGISDVPPVPNSEEVADYVYVDPEKLLDDLEKFPDQYTVWFRKIIERVLREVRSNKVSIKG